MLCISENQYAMYIINHELTKGVYICRDVCLGVVVYCLVLRNHSCSYTVCGDFLFPCVMPDKEANLQITVKMLKLKRLL